jgi:hypothetical protein
MTAAFDEFVRVPITRAELYPHDTDQDAHIDVLPVTCLGVILGINAGRITLTSSDACPSTDAYGVEFDLEATAARRLARQLLDAVDTLEGGG